MVWWVILALPSKECASFTISKLRLLFLPEAPKSPHHISFLWEIVVWWVNLALEEPYILEGDVYRSNNNLIIPIISH